MKYIYIFGGGTFNHVRNHFSLSAPAFGKAAKQLKNTFIKELKDKGLNDKYQVKLLLTKMAGGSIKLLTNDDVDKKIEQLIKDPCTKAIIFNVALTDFEGQIDDIESGKHAERLRTSEGNITMDLIPSNKIIGKIRKQRKDIFVVGFKTTTNHNAKDQYIRGLELLKKNSLNLVLANDTINHRNMIIAPEETIYGETTSRKDIFSLLTQMTVSRMQNKFTRSTVVKGDAVKWDSKIVPENLRKVVNHCIEKGAYKPFLGKTAGHFAVKLNENEILTSIRKTNYNNLEDIGLVKVESKNADEVIAHGFKPSVGGQSQRIIFNQHPQLDCIVHFHCPVKESDIASVVPVTQQWPNECGSHQCGQNTSNGLKEVLFEGHKISVVYLDKHGPNIVFNRNVPANTVINFIDQNFDLSKKTGGFVE